MPDFEVVSTTTAGSFGFLDVEERRVATPDGEELGRYVVTHPGAVAVVPVTEDGRVLMLRQYRVAAEGTLLEIPAGKRDVEGEPPEETARRELEEETRFTPGRLVKLAEFWNSPGFCTELTHVFLALDLRRCDTEHEVKAEERHMVLERVAFEDVDVLVASGALADAKSLVGLDLARRYLAGEYPGFTG